MVVRITVNSAGLQAKLANMNQPALLQKAGEDVADYLRTYHTRFRNNWKGSGYMAGPNSGLFWQRVVAGWQDPIVKGNSVIISNNFGLLKWKVTGGTITPITARALTIPLVPEAKGQTVEEYAASEGVKLFRVGKTLRRRVGKTTQGIYALVQSVTQSPWPGAMPDDGILRGVFAESIKKQMIADLTPS